MARQNRSNSNKPTAEKRAAIYARDGHTCCYCGCTVHPAAPTSDPQAATLDHLEPFSAGGTWDASNLVTACFACNRARGTLALTTWARLVLAHTFASLDAAAPAFARSIRRQAARAL